MVGKAANENEVDKLAGAAMQCESERYKRESRRREPVKVSPGDGIVVDEQAAGSKCDEPN